MGYPWPVPSAHVELAGKGRQAPGRKPQDQDQPVTEPDQQRRILRSETFPGEFHITVPPLVLSRGLRYVFGAPH